MDPTVGPPSTSVQTVPHTYAAAGSYTVSFTVQGLCPPDDQLPGAKSVEITVLVDPAPASTSTSTTEATTTTSSP